ncbi:MAG TPA: sigma-70 family RNA polymerase sigma factor [Sedimentisphaerales bacterium]|nr:sigma-70 family RNA polymerase sigma factor [Sedimentisphaerales bacterium]HNU31298.1 sigma-70 family RNA polymerase sigma factor [Sedimentisphaerales bacterium]
MSGREERTERLIVGDQSGSTEWARLYRDLLPEVRALLAARGASAQDADDLAQEVLTKLAWSKKPSDLKRYLATAAANALSDHRRRRTRERRLLQRLLEDAGRADEARRCRPGESGDDDGSRGDGGQVGKMLRALAPDDARLLRLRFWEGLPMAEVARRMGYSREAAYKRVERILERLRERYAVESPESGEGEDTRDS